MKNPQSLIIGSFHAPGRPLALASVALALLTSLTPLQAEPGNDNRAPEVPADLQVPEGNKVSFEAYAVGVQIYVWNGFTWVFQAPEAVLFCNVGENGEVAIHYGGPTWESNSGSKVMAALMERFTVDSSAIPWLLLRKVSTEGHGVFANTTYIQRVNTVGGLAPSAPGTVMGEEARVPYTAEYFFYRKMGR